MLHTRDFMIVGNWKMNLNVHDASLLVHQLHTQVKKHKHIEMVLAPTYLALQPLSLQIDRRKFRLASQDGYAKDSGAFTGEVSFAQLHGLVHYSIIGHSERRIYAGETLEQIRDKVAAAYRHDIVPILCIGETKQERQHGETWRVLHEQLTSALSNLTSEQVEQLVVAYEPVWAISTFGGELAKPSDVAVVIGFIREQVRELYGSKAAKHMRVLYGGSVDDQIVRGYLEIAGVDGALVGGASMHAHKFAGMVESARRLQVEQEGNQ
jgi:triosephosphate isomerase